MIGKFTEWLLENTDLLNEANTITNQPIPVDKDSNYNSKIISILRSIEQPGLVLSYSNTKSNYALRFVCEPGNNYYGALVQTKDDRPELYENIMKIIKNNNNVIKYIDGFEELDEDKIYIRTVKRGDDTISSLYKGLGSKRIPTTFSSAGGLELYDPEENASYIIDFELKGSARTDSAVNTKLREVTPVALFALFEFKDFNKFFNEPSANFNLLKNKILKLKSMSPKLNAAFQCDLDVLKNVFDFDANNSNNAYRIKAYKVGVNTLKEIIKKYNTVDGQYVTQIKYTGLETMNSRESTEDIIVVTQFNKRTKETTDIKISLKSGNYKARENTFVTFIKRLNMNANIIPGKKTIINGKTLSVKGYITDTNGFYVNENQKTFVNAFFDFIDKLNISNKQKFAEGIKAIILPDPSIEIWNVTESNMKDLKDEYLQLYNYKYVNLIRKRNTQQVIIELYNNKTDKNDTFRFRWYKRSGPGMISEYKLLVEPNK